MKAAERTAGPPSPQAAAVLAKPPPARLFDRERLATTLPIFIAMALIWTFFEFQTGGKFIGPRNLSEMLQEYSYKPVLAIGVVFVLLLGEIDLSVGYLTLLSATAVGILSQNAHWPAIPAILAGIVVCTILGLAQGFLISWVRMPAFVVTLGGFLIFEGVAYHVLSGATINVFDPFIGAIGTLSLPPSLGWTLALVGALSVAVAGWYERAARARAGLANPPTGTFAATTVGIAVLLLGTVGLLNAYRGIPLSFAILMVLALAFWFVARHTAFGRHVYAVGGNVEAARRAGINTIWIRWVCFGISGLTAGIAGVMLVGYSQAASTTSAGPDLLLDVISIAVIGGVSLSGGRGSVWAILLGGLLIASLDSGLNLMSVDPNFVYVIKGAILLLAILLDVLGKRNTSTASR